MPQLWLPPTLTCSNVPPSALGPATDPSTSAPQHSSVESDLTAQVSWLPALTWVNVPPSAFGPETRAPPVPQHSRVLSSLIAHECVMPAETSG
jgi:hypothetical protein